LFISRAKFFWVDTPAWKPLWYDPV
jgi:hypothetical protein